MRTVRPPRFLTIMVPTRKRFEKLQHMLRSFLSQIPVEERSLVEFIIRFDSDDTESVQRIPELPFRDIDIQVIVGDKLGGYKDLYHFYNECAKLSFGQYLLMWNDDATFRNHDWFPRFRQVVQDNRTATSYWFAGTPTLIYEEGKNPRQDDWPCFIAHHRALYQIIGFYGDLGGVDSFLYYVLGPLGLLKKIQEIEIEHQAWFQIDPAERDETAVRNGDRGQMLPTDFAVVKECQERIVRFVQQRSGAPSMA